MNATSAHYRTILTISTALLILFHFTEWNWAFIVPVFLGIMAVASATVARKIHEGWMLLARILGYIIPNVLLTMVFYFVLFPIAILARIFRKDRPIILENRPSGMFRDRNKTFEAKDFKNPW